MTNNRRLEIDGETHCVSEWAERFNIRPSVIYDRINKLGWNIKKSLTTPVNGKYAPTI